MKKAPTLFPVHDLIRDRWSPRSFSNKGLTSADVQTLIEAASWSFSSGNLQPWHFLYAHRGSSGFDRILNHLSPGNQPWAKNAAVLLVSLAKKERDPGKPNFWARHDLGAANMLLALQATSMGFFGHPMGGFDSAGLSAALEINTSVFEIVTCMAIGYADNPRLLDQDQYEKEIANRSRKSIEQISKDIS